MTDIDVTKISDETIIVLDDLCGNSSKIVKGRLGLIHVANYTIENMIEDVKEMNLDGYNLEEPTKFTDDDINNDDIEQAIRVLDTDSYDVVVYENNPLLFGDYLVGENIDVYKHNDHLLVVELTEIKFNEENIYEVE